MRSYRLVRSLQNGFLLLDRDEIPVGDPTAFLRALQTRGLSIYSLRAYGFDLVALYRWMDSQNLSVTDLNTTHLLHFIQSRQDMQTHPRSINRMLITIRSFFRFCTGKELEYTTRSTLPAGYYKGRGRDRSLGLHAITAPKHRLLQIKVPRTLVNPLTIDQVRHLFALASRHRDLCIMYLMLFCGLRSQEVINLELSSVCFKNCTIRVRGKGNKERIVPIVDSVSKAITQYLQLERPQFCPCQALFVVLQGRRYGLPLSAEGLRNLFRYRRRQEDLKNANPHRLRHTFGADMARAGLSLNALQKLMGHSDPRVTLQYINLSLSDISNEFEIASEKLSARYHRP